MHYRKLIGLLMISTLSLTACIGQDPTTLEKESPFNDLPSEFQKQGAAVRISSEQETYSLPIEQIHLVIENTGSKEIGFSAAIYLEKLEEDDWYQIPYKNLGFTDAEIGIAVGETYIDEVPIDMLHYQLQEGTYRIMKSFHTESEQKILAAEFVIE